MTTATAAPAPDLTAFARVPEALTERPQWVVWRFESREGDKPTKVPLNARTGTLAATNNPATWVTWGEALEAFAGGVGDGVGFVFSADDPFCGVDFDNCIDDAGNIEATARGYIDRLNSYIEVSPSGRGAKCIVRATIPDGRGRKNARFEVYDRLRFFTITGRHLDGMPYSIEDRQAELLAIRDEIFPPAKPAPAERRAPQPSGDADDSGIIEKVTADLKWARLWNGDTSDYGSPSEADLALMGRIGFFCGWDPGRMEALFNQSGLTRDKWNRADYRQQTIDKARAGKSESYTWHRSNGEHRHNGNGQAKPEPQPEEMTAAGPRAKLRTNIGNAARFVIRHGRDVRYSYPLGAWYVWTGNRWAVDERGDVLRRAKDTALAIYREAAEETDDAKRAAVADHATKTQKRERLTAMLELAKPDLAIVPDDLDTDPHLFNCPNGTVDLRTMTLHPHRREDYITKLAGADYDPAATRPVFK